jgi:Rrf2 family protein
MSGNSQFAVALHILTLLAQDMGEAITSELIGGSVNTNPVFIRRILGALSRVGLVASQPGVGGGWRLLRDPATISLLDVYHTIDDGHLLSLHHSVPNPDCLIGRNIQGTLMEFFGEAEQAFERVLAQRTVAEVLQAAIKDSHAQIR